MLVDNQCAIYEYRPQTFRDFDCRVFAATSVPVNQQTQAEIVDRVKAWVFHYESEECREEHMILKEAADLFPQGSLPNYPAQLAALAVRIYRLFSKMTVKMRNDLPVISDSAIAHAILIALSEPEASSKLADARYGRNGLGRVIRGKAGEFVRAKATTAHPVRSNNTDLALARRC